MGEETIAEISGRVGIMRRFVQRIARLLGDGGRGVCWLVEGRLFEFSENVVLVLWKVKFLVAAQNALLRLPLLLRHPGRGRGRREHGTCSARPIRWLFSSLAKDSSCM
jgi:hypothetical protein